MNGSFADDWDSRGDGPAGGDDGLCGLDDESLERLLEDTDAESLPALLLRVAEVLVAVRAPATAEELAGEADAVAQFRATRSRQNLAWTAESRRPRRRTTAVAVAATLTFLSAAGAAAATGRLPDDLQDMASQMLSKIGITVPSSRPEHPPTRPDPADHDRPLSPMPAANSTTAGDPESDAPVPRSTPRPPQRDPGTQRSTRRPRHHMTRPQSPRPRSPSNRSSRSNRSTAPPPTSSQRRQAHRPRHRPSRRQHRPPHRQLIRASRASRTLHRPHHPANHPHHPPNMLRPPQRPPAHPHTPLDHPPRSPPSHRHTPPDHPNRSPPSHRHTPPDHPLRSPPAHRHTPPDHPPRPVDHVIPTSGLTNTTSTRRIRSTHVARGRTRVGPRH